MLIRRVALNKLSTVSSIWMYLDFARSQWFTSASKTNFWKLLFQYFYIARYARFARGQRLNVYCASDYAYRMCSIESLKSETGCFDSSNNGRNTATLVFSTKRSISGVCHDAQSAERIFYFLFFLRTFFFLLLAVASSALWLAAPTSCLATIIRGL